MRRSIELYRDCRIGERGFTLVEILVAFMIASVALAAVFAALGDGLSAERRASESVRRTLEAWSRLEEVVASPETGPREGLLATGEVWRTEARPLTDPALAVGGEPIAWEVVLTVVRDGRETLRLGAVALSR